MLDLRLAVSDLTVGTMPVKVKCPDRVHKARSKQTDKNNSLAVYPESIHCYGCGFNRMGVWGLAALLDVDIDEARRLQSRYTSESLDAYRDRAAQEARTDPLSEALAKLYNDMLMGPNAPRAHRQDWLLARGLTPATWERFHLGHNGTQFVVPIFDADGQLIALRFRRDDAYLDESYPKYTGVKGRNGAYIYPEPQLASDTRDWVIVVEGELDAVRLWQDGKPAAAVTNGAGQVPKLVRMLAERYPRIKTVYIATDMDEPGREAAKLSAQAATECGLKPVILGWAEGKDVTECLALGGRLEVWDGS